MVGSKQYIRDFERYPVFLKQKHEVITKSEEPDRQRTTGNKSREQVRRQRQQERNKEKGG